MVHCVVFGCAATQKRNPGRSFHQFPKDKKLEKMWINRINRKNWSPCPTSLVCSYHFRVEDYSRKRLSDVPDEFQKKRLKKDAVPSCNLRGEERDTRIYQRKTCTSQRASGTVTADEKPSCSTVMVSSKSSGSSVNDSTITIPSEEQYIPKQEELEKIPQQEQLEKLKGEIAVAHSVIAVLVDKTRSQAQQLDQLKCDTEATLLSMAAQSSRILSATNMTNAEVHNFTGLSKDIFELIVKQIDRFQPLTYWTGKIVQSVSTSDQLLIMLLKMKFDLPSVFLAKLFNLSHTSINNIFLTYLHVMHELFFKEFLNQVPSVAKHLCTTPQKFHGISNCRMIIDCTEFFIETPRKDLKAACSSFSNYKKRLTAKYLIGVAPNGAITFISDGYPGSTSDKMITKLSGVLQHFQAGDLVLADKGFVIHELMPSGVSLNLPPFLAGKKQFTENEAKFCKKIASCRIHVERAIERIRNYKILNLITSTKRPFVDKLVQLCGVLVNLQSPTIQGVFERYLESNNPV